MAKSTFLTDSYKQMKMHVHVSLPDLLLLHIFILIEHMDQTWLQQARNESEDHKVKNKEHERDFRKCWNC